MIKIHDSLLTHICGIYPTNKLHCLSSVAHNTRYLEAFLDLELFYCLTVNIVDVIKVKNLLDFCENLLESILESPRKSKSKSAVTPDLGKCTVS